MSSVTKLRILKIFLIMITSLALVKSFYSNGLVSIGSVIAVLVLSTAIRNVEKAEKNK